MLVSMYVYFFLDAKAVSYVMWVVAFFSIISPLLLKDDKWISFERIIKDYKNRYDSEVIKVKKLESAKRKVSFEKSELIKALEKINLTLQKENISKEELIRSVDSSLKAVIFFKTWEDTENKRALFQKKVYPSLGIVNIRSGLAMLPPRSIPQEKSNKEIIKWFIKKIVKEIPEDYEFSMPIISVIDIKKSDSFKRLKPFRRFQKSFLDFIPINELVPTNVAMNFLHQKKHLSSRDIIEIPNLIFLIEDYLISKEDYESIKKNNSKILSIIQKKVNSTELKTTDLATIEIESIKEALDKYVSDKDVIAERIKMNASFWKSYFENRK